MKKRNSKNSSLNFSVLGTGCWSFGGGKYWGDQNQKEVDKIVSKSVDLGINYFDTAEAYNDGRSESSLGIALQSVNRDKVLIGTKVSPSNCYKNTLIEHCEASLKRLQTDYIDLYMVHWPIHSHSIRHFTREEKIIKNPPRMSEVLEGLRKLKDQGKIREYGVSNFSSKRLEEITPIEEIAVNELPYNLLCRGIEYETLPFCKKKGIGIIGYMALLQGILADVYSSLSDVPIWQRRTRHFNCKNNKECRHGEKGVEKETEIALKKLRDLSQETGLTMADLAIRWVLENTGITCTLVGSRNIKQLEANVDAANIIMSQEIKNELDTISLSIKDKLGKHFDYYESAANDRNTIN